MDSYGSKIIDAVMFFNELDMYETRLNILDGVVDHFIVIEAGMTHSGDPKGTPFKEALNTGRFDQWKHKITYGYVPALEGGDSWARERFNRWCLGNYIKVIGDWGDMVIVADCDEIPNPDALLDIPDEGARLEMQFFYYDLQHRVREGWSIGILPYGVEANPNHNRTLHGHEDVKVVQNGGWHLSYFLPPNQVVDKVNAFMHHADVAKNMPRDPVWVAQQIADGKDLFGRTTQIERVGLADDLPKYILDNQEKYRAMGWIR